MCWQRTPHLRAASLHGAHGHGRVWVARTSSTAPKTDIPKHLEAPDHGSTAATSGCLGVQVCARPFGGTNPKTNTAIAAEPPEHDHGSAPMASVQRTS